jgi:hypothetical protein
MHGSFAGRNLELNVTPLACQRAQPAFLPFAIICAGPCLTPAGVDSKDSDEIKRAQGPARTLHGGFECAVALLGSIMYDDDGRNMFKQQRGHAMSALFSVFDFRGHVAKPLRQPTGLFCAQCHAAPWIAIRSRAHGVLGQNQ